MNEYDNYIRRMEEIRVLSTPMLDDISDADEYSDRLRENFIKVGQLAAENRIFLDTVLYPLLSAEEISDEDKERLIAFSDDLICAEHFENLDLQMFSRVSDRMAMDVKIHGSVCDKVRGFDLQIANLYEHMNMTQRIHAYPDIAENYRRRGLELSEFFLGLLEREQFKDIEDVEIRQTILTNARYSIAFFEGISNDPEANEKQLMLLDRMLEIADDPFYIDLLEDFDWIYHRFRSLQYYAMTVEKHNAAGYSPKQMETILSRTQQLKRLWEGNAEHLIEILDSDDDEHSIKMMLKRVEYLMGKITREEYLDSLLEIYGYRDSNSYAPGKIYTNLIIPMEIMYALDRTNISEMEKDLLHDNYQDVLSYAFRMPNGNTLTGMLEYLYDIIDGFIEIPSCLTFEDMVLQMIAAIHPPTYVHSLMVGQITECLCGHLLRLMPEKLVGVLGYETAEDVIAHKDEVRDFAYHAALCHDFGKISIIDTVFVYGRKLLDEEFNLIKTHPRTGYELLSRFASTRRYAEVALGHHRWYDDSRGYPDDFETAKSKSKPIIDIVLCADCLDAATDTIGRSYSKGKALSEFVEELEEGNGSHYAPYMVDLFRNCDVEKDINHLLETGRKRNYRNTYFLLRDMHER
ncbi:MAG: HD domain-containing protein [Lachnospiraceae bacterium]|nr:HD domain-containing protein [Lachnospiraceae bacterium]